MKILLAGGSGFIGKYLLDELSGENELIVIGRQKDISKVHSQEGDSFKYNYTDYCYESIKKIIQTERPDAVLNLAAQRLSKEKNKLNRYIANLTVSSNLYECSLNQGITNIVDISTIGVYTHENNSMPWSEDDNIKPNNPYALSKAWVEQAADYFNRKGARIKILRLAQVIGKGERAGYVLQIYLENALKGEPIKVFGKSIGKRHYIYVKDVAKAISAALSHTETSGIFNVGMDAVYSFKEIALTINKIFGEKSNIVEAGDIKADEKKYFMNIEKARSELSWQPAYNLHQAYNDIAGILPKV